ncbi:MAG: sigma-70 family RNA polymerase sigma factor [Phycisphaerae bacterium]|nr:sigma-70 family RNA polymerase sigma factor [Phycisphaerae bacterium]
MLYETYDPRIVALMMRMTGGDPEEAFDLSQETFVRVFDKIGGFRGDSALGTWIHRVAVNQALQHLRRKKRYRRITEAFAEHTERAGTTTEDHEASMDVRDAMDQLPERMGTMVRLHYEEGMRYSQIAEELAVKPGTVASCLSRARRQLRPLLR